MKKKIFLVALLALGLTSCNIDRIDTNYKFTKAHLISAEKCVEISSWKTLADGEVVQITLKDDTVLLGHSNEIIIVKGTCPYCK